MQTNQFDEKFCGMSEKVPSFKKKHIEQEAERISQS